MNPIAVYDLTEDRKSLLQLVIPTTLRYALLPASTGTIASLLQFSKLPQARASIEDSQQRTSAWFSSDPPEADFDALGQLPRWPLPPAVIIRQLVDLLGDGQGSPDGSIIPAHLSEGLQGRRLPLWVLTYWIKAWDAQSAQASWRKAVRWMDAQSRGFPEGTAMKQDILELLRMTRWNETLHGPGISGARLETLTTYLSFDWLAGAHVADRIHAMYDQLCSSSWDAESPHLLVDLEFAGQVLGAYRDQKQYATGTNYSYLRKVEHDLSHGLIESIGGLAHVNGNHYIAFVLDAPKQHLHFGDPMHQPIPQDVRASLTWWFQQLLEEGLDREATETTDAEVSECSLPVTRQRDDNSCAVLSLNALMHHYAPDTAPLLPTGNKDALVLERMTLAYRMLTMQSLYGPQDTPDAFDGLVNDFKFSFSCPPNLLSAGSAQSYYKDAPPLRIPSPDCGTPDDEERLPDESVDIPPVSDTEAESSAWESSSAFSAEDAAELSLLSGDRDDVSYKDSSSEDEKESLPGHGFMSREMTASSPVPKTRQSLRDVCIGKKQTTLTAFKGFDEHETPEERRLRRQREDLKDAAAKEERKEEQCMEKDQQEVKKKADARERQRLCRARKKAAAEAEEKKQTAAAAGKKRAYGGEDEADQGRAPKLQRLRECDDTSVGVSPTLAETSRPYRAFKQVQQEKRRLTHPRREGPAKPAERMNWQAPHLWAMIEEAVKTIGYPWYATEIVRHLKRQSSTLFNGLSHRRICDWRDLSITDRFVWKDSTLKRVARGYRQHYDSTRKGVLDAYPDIVKDIVQQLSDLRDTSVALDITVIRGIMIAVLTHRAPEIFERVDKQGHHFKCPEVFVRRFLKRTLGWSIRRCTRAGHKFPRDVDDVCRRFFLRNAVTIRDEDITKPCFIVNSDQTQVLYSAGNKLTWNKKGAKQVSVVGADEKRAFTSMVGVSASGEMLPLQAIYHGVDPKKSLPQPGTRGYDEAMRLKFRLELSKTKTYWSTMGTMRSYVIFILAPYFDHWRVFHNRPTQKCIWNIDVWSVHRSEEFRGWMKSEYVWIIVIFVPGGCTPLLQACDVGIQKIYKLGIKKSLHADVVEETLQQLRKGVEPAAVLLQKKLGVLRDRSVQWMVDGYNAVNKVDVVKKAFKLCQAGPFDMSFESLTSLEARQALNELKTSDPVFYAEITSGHIPDTLPTGHDGMFVEDQEVPTDDHAVDEDSATKVASLEKAVLGSKSASDLLPNDSDDAYSDSDVEVEVPGDDLVEEPAPAQAVDGGEASTGSGEGEGAEVPEGRRRRIPAKRYKNGDWVRTDDSDDELAW